MKVHIYVVGASDEVDRYIKVLQRQVERVRGLEILNEVTFSRIPEGSITQVNAIWTEAYKHLVIVVPTKEASPYEVVSTTGIKFCGEKYGILFCLPAGNELEIGMTLWYEIYPYLKQTN